MVLVPESRKINQKKLRLLEYNRDTVLKGKYFSSTISLWIIFLCDTTAIIMRMITVLQIVYK